MAEQSQAWLLTPPGLPPFAVGQHEVMQYLNSAPTKPVPFALYHCASAIFWQDDIVPVMNLSVLNGSPEPVRDLAVLAYQDTPGTPLRYVALALQKAPERITVDDTGSCDLPADNAELWERIAIACFTRNSQPTPIISIQRLCSAEFRDFAEQKLAHLPAPVMQPTLSPNPLTAVPTAAKIAQSGPAPVIDASTANSRELAENLRRNNTDVLDDARHGEFDAAEMDDDLDSLEAFDEDDAELDLDDDLDGIDTLDDEFDDTEDLADTADLEDNTDLDIDESLDDESDAEDLTDTADLEDNTDLDSDESLDDDDAAWLEDREDDGDDEDTLDDEFDDDEDLADSTDLADDTDLDGDESLNDATWLDDDEADILDDELDDDENLADTADLEDDADLNDDESLDDAAWLDDDEADILDDELDDDENLADSTDLADDTNLDDDESLDDAAWLDDELDNDEDLTDTADLADDADLDADESLDDELEQEDCSVAISNR